MAAIAFLLGLWLRYRSSLCCIFVSTGFTVDYLRPSINTVLHLIFVSSSSFSVAVDVHQVNPRPRRVRFLQAQTLRVRRSRREAVSGVHFCRISSYLVSSHAVHTLVPSSWVCNLVGGGHQGTEWGEFLTEAPHRPFCGALVLAFQSCPFRSSPKKNLVGTLRHVRPRTKRPALLTGDVVSRTRESKPVP